MRDTILILATHGIFTKYDLRYNPSIIYINEPIDNMVARNDGSARHTLPVFSGSDADFDDWLLSLKKGLFQVSFSVDL